MGASSVRIADLPGAVGAEVEIRGWVEGLRKSGGIRFALLRDGTGRVQAVVREQDVAGATWERSAALVQ